MINKKNLLQLLGEQHKFWVGTVYSFGGKGEYAIPKQDAESIVSDMYIKLNKYVQTPERILHKDGTLNKTFIYVTLRNLFINYVNKNAKNHHKLFDDSLLKNYQFEEIDYELDWKRFDLDENIKKEIETWHHYDAKLFKLIFYQGMSMRKLSRETKISLSSIFNTIKTCKLKLKAKFQDEYNKTIE